MNDTREYMVRDDIEKCGGNGVRIERVHYGVKEREREDGGGKERDGGGGKERDGGGG